MTASAYAELHCHSYFSLLDGASSPEELVARAGELELAGLALTDHDSLAGAVRFWAAARRTGLHAILGAEVTLADGAHLTLLAATQDGYANLCRLITASRRLTGGNSDNPAQRRDAQQPGQAWAGKMPPALALTQLAEHAGGLIALTGCRRGLLAGALLRGEAEAAYTAARQLAEIFGAGNLYVELQQHGLPDDDWLMRRLVALARRVHLPLVATRNAHYATPDRSLLRDVLIAVRHNTTLADAQRGGWLPLNSRYALAAPAEMARRFAQWPEALTNTVAIAERCQVSLDFSAVRLPVFVGEEITQSRKKAEVQRENHVMRSVTGGAPPSRRAETRNLYGKRPQIRSRSFDFLGKRKDAKTDERCTAPISSLAISQSPDLPISPFQTLYDLCHTNLPRCYPTLQPAVISQLAHELAIIEQARLAGYFLVVWDIVRFARSQGIRCQGRGSAANSIVAYLLGITSIDPLAHNLLFERFLSSDKFTMPDIDIDFAADRREEVIQYVYQKYGRDQSAMVCYVVTYRARSALRDLGKALELPEEMIVRIQSRLDTNMPAEAAAQIEKLSMGDGQRSMVNGQWATGNGQQAAVNEESGEEERQSTIDHLLPLLLRQIDGCPRHLSIHSGGMLITAAPLAAIVPLEPAAMPDRVVCQWDKDSVEDAGLIKIDLLSLRTLGMVSEALEHIAAQGQPAPDLDRLPLDDPEIYGLLHRGDTIGAFQVESRAQQQMLPRLKPVCFEDIAVEVAIVRPGPIQGGAVHPYLRRRSGLEPVSYLHPSLEPVLAESLGVLLFQEQAIRISVAAAGFAPGEADMLRRALSRNRSHEEMAAMRGRFVRGAAENGIDAATAEAIFAQLAGFAGYGFCKSHAASFALIAYQTLWLKRYHAPAFYCALLNQQPMGFYPPEVIVGDARRHHVDTLPPDINRSDWRYTLEHTPTGRWALRTGLHAISGVGEQAWARIAAARADGPFADLEDLCHRARLSQDVMESLIRAGACDAFGARRPLLWACAAFDYRADGLDLSAPAIAAALPALPASEETAWEYELMGLSPRQQLMVHYRRTLRAAGLLTAGEVKQQTAGRKVRVAGYAVVRQRPATAKGIVFYSLEDESGLVDLVVKPDVYARLRDVLRNEPLIAVGGVVQRSGRAVSVLVWEAARLADGG